MLSLPPVKLPSHSLHHLISSLSGSEKRYFILAAKGDDHIYVDLFKAISKSKIYDESKIRKKIGVASPGAFKKLKNYTFNKILKSLETYYSENSSEFIARRKLMQADILVDKKQYAEARKLLRAVLQQALQKDLLFLLPLCYERLYKTGVNAARPDLSLRELDPEVVAKASRDCGRLLRIKHFNSLFWNYIHTSSEVPTTAELALLRKIAKDTLAVFKQEESGFSIKREAFSLLGLAYRFAGDAENSYTYRKKLVELIKAEPSLLLERRHEYFTSLGNLFNICRDMRKLNEAADAFETAQDFILHLPSRLRDFRLDESYCNLKNNYVTVLFNEGKYEDVIRHGEELQKEIKRHDEQFENSLVTILYRNLMMAHFYRKDFRAALRFYNLGLKRYPKDDVINRLFGLVVYYEAGDIDALHYLCRSLLYFTAKSNPYPAIRILVQHLDLASQKITSKKDEKEYFVQLQVALKKHKKFMDELHQAVKYDFLGWIGSKTR